MKRTVIGSLIFLLFAGISVYFATKRAETNSAEIPKKYTVAVLDNDVSVRLDSTSAWEKISNTTQVEVGAEIKTSADGRAKILYPNGTITTIEGDSHVAISALTNDGNESRLSLIVGSIWSKIQNILGTDEYYEVETGNIVASVRGTIFALEYRNATSTVYGIGNTVRVAAKDPRGTALPDTQIQIASGEKVTVVGTPAITVGNTPLPVSHMSDEEVNSDIIARNLIELDEDDREDDWNEGVKDLIKRLRKHSSPSASSSKTPTPSPTAVASLNPVLVSVNPTTIRTGQNFDLVGKNFRSLSGSRQVDRVYIGSKSVDFNTDSTTVIEVDPGSLKSGVYDVKIVSTKGVESVLPKALTIR